MIGVLLRAVEQKCAVIQIGKHGAAHDVFVSAVNEEEQKVTIVWGNQYTVDYRFEDVKQVNDCKIMKMERENGKIRYSR